MDFRGRRQGAAVRFWGKEATYLGRLPALSPQTPWGIPGAATLALAAQFRKA